MKRDPVSSLQRDVVYLGWPIASFYMSPNAGGGLRRLSQWVQLYTWVLTKFGDLWTQSMRRSLKKCNQRQNSWTKSRQSLQSFPPCYSQSPLQLCLEISIYFFKQTHATYYSFYSSVAVHCTGERRKKWENQTPFLMASEFRNPYRNFKIMPRNLNQTVCSWIWPQSKRLKFRIWPGLSMFGRSEQVFKLLKTDDWARVFSHILTDFQPWFTLQNSIFNKIQVEPVKMYKGSLL